jgi:Na+/glutamate symporter
MFINNLGLILFCVIIAIIVSIISTKITFNYFIKNNFDLISKFSLDVLNGTNKIIHDMLNHLNK